jgi:hypothetical protein
MRNSTRASNSIPERGRCSQSQIACGKPLKNARNRAPVTSCGHKAGAVNKRAQLLRDVLHYDAGRIEMLACAGVPGPAAGQAGPSGQ